jgi:hypothetical protein
MSKTFGRRRSFRACHAHQLLNLFGQRILVTIMLAKRTAVLWEGLHPYNVFAMRSTRTSSCFPFRFSRDGHV